MSERSDRTYNAVIFDMDGVLTDSEPLYLEATNAVLAPLGRRLTGKQSRAFMGTSVTNSWQGIMEALGLEGELDRYVQDYDRELLRLLAQPKEPLPGVRSLIDRLRRKRVPLGLASSSWRTWVDTVLGAAGLTGLFDVVVAGDMVENEKPAPDAYLAAARELGIAPSRCIALEDTPAGLAAARAAGTFVIQVRAASTAFPPLPEAHAVLDSLEDFDLSLVEAPDG
jgi:HAD superfamily hydrolase (TIGR01509 family)